MAFGDAEVLLMQMQITDLYGIEIIESHSNVLYIDV